MPAAGRNTVDVVDGSGTFNDSIQGSTYVEGKLWVVVGWKGLSHPPCPLPIIHCTNQWVMTDGSPTTYIEGIKVCRIGDPASCGHTETTGSGTVFAN